MICVVQGAAYKQRPDLIFCGLKHGPALQEQLNERTSSNGKSRNRSSTIKNARKKLEIPVEAGMPRKLRTTKRPNKLLETDSEATGSNKMQKTKHACIVEAHESRRKRLEPTPSRNHEDHIARKKGFQFDKSPQSGAQVFVLPDAKAAVDKEWEKLEKLPAWQVIKNEQAKGGYSGSTKGETNSPLCYTDGLLSSQKCGVGTRIPVEKKDESCFEVTLWKTTLEPTQYLLNRVRLRLKWQQQQWWT